MSDLFYFILGSNDHVEAMDFENASIATFHRRQLNSINVNYSMYLFELKFKILSITNYKNKMLSKKEYIYKKYIFLDM